MTNWFHFDNCGKKYGQVMLAQVKDLVAKWVITRKTPMDTEEGQKEFAEQINGLFSRNIESGITELLQRGETLLRNMQAFHENRENERLKAITITKWILGSIGVLLGAIFGTALGMFVSTFLIALGGTIIGGIITGFVFIGLVVYVSTEAFGNAANNIAAGAGWTCSILAFVMTLNSVKDGEVTGAMTVWCVYGTVVGGVAGWACVKNIAEKIYPH